MSSYVRDPHLDLDLIWIIGLDATALLILLSLLRIPSESGLAMTPYPLIRFASEYMRWKALLKGFPYDGVLSTTTCDNSGA
jgi:hypothetical protein